MTKDEGAANAGERGWTPPYIAWQNLLSLIERLETDMPPQVDRTILTGSNQSRTQTLNALKALDLIGEDGSCSATLKEIVEAGERRPEVVRELLEHFYSEPVRLASINATQMQLEKAFRDYGVTGSTARKSIAFFLKAAKYADLPMSPHFKTPPARRESGPRASRRRKKPAQKRASSQKSAVAEDVSSLRVRYIEMLIKKVEESDDMDGDLMDRIEQLLNDRGGRNVA